MKVLITARGIPHQPHNATGQQLAEGFRQAGHEAIVYGNYYGEPYRWIGVEEATTEKFDLIIISETNDGYPLYTGLLDYSNLKDTPVIYQDYDVSYHPEISLRRAKAYKPDAFLVANKYFLGEDGFSKFGKPVLHLPYACSPQLHRRVSEIQRQYLMGFVGSLTKEREELFNRCRNITNKLCDIYVTTGIYAEELVRQTNQFSIILHLNQQACKGMIPMRPWESAAILIGATIYKAIFRNMVVQQKGHRSLFCCFAVYFLKC